MKHQLEEELIVGLMPYIQPENIADAKLVITMKLGEYDVKKEETSLTVYEGDVNELILRRFLAAKLAKGCSPRTITCYRNSVRMTLEKIGKPYMDVTADDVRLYIATRIHKDHISKTTANNERRFLSSFYDWLQKEEILLRNPMRKVEQVKETKKKKKAFTAMEIEKLRYACKTSRETAIVEVLLSTWCRVSELAEIKLTDISDGKVTVHGKGDKYRECFLNAKACLALDNYLSERSDQNPYLFPRAKNAGDVKSMIKGHSKEEQREWYKYSDRVDETRRTDTGTIEAIIRKIGKRAGVENTHPHRFRRTGATMALRNGMPILQVSKILGHEDIGTTQIYLDISIEELEQAHKKFSY